MAQYGKIRRIPQHMKAPAHVHPNDIHLFYPKSPLEDIGEKVVNPALNSTLAIALSVSMIPTAALAVDAASQSELAGTPNTSTIDSAAKAVELEKAALLDAKGNEVDAEQVCWTNLVSGGVSVHLAFTSEVSSDFEATFSLTGPNSGLIIASEIQQVSVDSANKVFDVNLQFDDLDPAVLEDGVYTLRLATNAQDGDQAGLSKDVLGKLGIDRKAPSFVEQAWVAPDMSTSENDQSLLYYGAGSMDVMTVSADDEMSGGVSYEVTSSNLSIGDSGNVSFSSENCRIDNLGDVKVKATDAAGNTAEFSLAEIAYEGAAVDGLVKESAPQNAQAILTNDGITGLRDGQGSNGCTLYFDSSDVRLLTVSAQSVFGGVTYEVTPGCGLQVDDATGVVSFAEGATVASLDNAVVTIADIFGGKVELNLADVLQYRGKQIQQFVVDMEAPVLDCSWANASRVVDGDDGVNLYFDAVSYDNPIASLSCVDDDFKSFSISENDFVSINEANGDVRLKNGVDRVSAADLASINVSVVDYAGNTRALNLGEVLYKADGQQKRIASIIRDNVAPAVEYEVVEPTFEEELLYRGVSMLVGVYNLLPSDSSAWVKVKATDDGSGIDQVTLKTGSSVKKGSLVGDRYVFEVSEADGVLDSMGDAWLIRAFDKAGNATEKTPTGGIVAADATAPTTSITAENVQDNASYVLSLGEKKNITAAVSDNLLYLQHAYSVMDGVKGTEADAPVAIVCATGIDEAGKAVALKSKTYRISDLQLADSTATVGRIDLSLGMEFEDETYSYISYQVSFPAVADLAGNCRDENQSFWFDAYAEASAQPIVTVDDGLSGKIIHESDVDRLTLANGEAQKVVLTVSDVRLQELAKQNRTSVLASVKGVSGTHVLTLGNLVEGSADPVFQVEQLDNTGARQTWQVVVDAAAALADGSRALADGDYELEVDPGVVAGYSGLKPDAAQCQRSFAVDTVAPKLSALTSEGLTFDASVADGQKNSFFLTNGENHSVTFAFADASIARILAYANNAENNWNPIIAVIENAETGETVKTVRMSDLATSSQADASDKAEFFLDLNDSSLFNENGVYGVRLSLGATDLADNVCKLAPKDGRTNISVVKDAIAPTMGYACDSALTDGATLSQSSDEQKHAEITVEDENLDALVAQAKKAPESVYNAALATVEKTVMREDGRQTVTEQQTIRVSDINLNANDKTKGSVELNFGPEQAAMVKYQVKAASAALTDLSGNVCASDIDDARSFMLYNKEYAASRFAVDWGNIDSSDVAWTDAEGTQWKTLATDDDNSDQTVAITLRDLELSSMIAQATANEDKNVVLARVVDESGSTVEQVKLADLDEDGTFASGFCKVVRSTDGAFEVATATLNPAVLSDGRYQLSLYPENIRNNAGLGPVSVSDTQQIAKNDARNLIVDTAAPVVVGLASSALAFDKDVSSVYNNTYYLTCGSQANRAEQKIALAVSDANIACMLDNAKSLSDVNSSYDPVVARVVKADDSSVVREVHLSEFALSGEGKAAFSLDVVCDTTNGHPTFGDGDYIVSITPDEVTDLARNVAVADTATGSNAMRFVVDTVSPEVQVSSSLDEATCDKSSDQQPYSYLRVGEDETVSISVFDENLSALVKAIDGTKASTPLISVKGEKAGEVASISLRDLYRAATGALAIANVDAQLSDDGKKLTADIHVSNTDAYAEDTYAVNVAKNGVTDLSGNVSANDEFTRNFVADRTPSKLSVAEYGANSNEVIDMQNSYAGGFFYREFDSNTRFVRVQAVDTALGGTDSSASGIKSVKLVGGNDVISFNDLQNGVRLYQDRSMRDYVWMAFSADARIQVSDIKLEVTDNANNVKAYQMTQDSSGTLGVVEIDSRQNGASIDNPNFLVNDRIAPTSSITFGGLNGYYSTDQSGMAHLADANLDLLLGYARSYPASNYNATVARVLKTDNAGNTTVSAVRVADFGASTATQSSYGFSFNEDADYHIEYTPTNVYDLSNNRCMSANQTVEFTVDKIAPTVDVAFDNNDVLNGKYYKAGRTATITVVEHNFDPSLISISTNGAISGWSSNGDVHTATVSFLSDGVYNLSVSGQDLAGNTMNPYAADEFVVDLTAPSISISGVEDHHAYNGQVAPVISFSDEANFDASTIEYTLVGNKVGAVSYDASQAAEGNGATVTFADFEHVITVDDIYTLSATVRDMAGNEYTTQVTFSVNRFGSNFVVEGADGKGDADLGYIDEAPEIVVREINVTGIEQSSVAVTYNLKTTNLRQNDSLGKSGFTVTDESADNGYGWQEYVYTIAKESFGSAGSKDEKDKKDGNYVVTVSSKDEAGNTNLSGNFWVDASDSRVADKPKQEDGQQQVRASSVVKFTLDTTKPEIVGTNIQDGGVYNQSGSYEASFTVTDNIGFDKDNGISITIDGNQVDYSIDDEGVVRFAIDEHPFTLQEVKVVVEDYASNLSYAPSDDDSKDDLRSQLGKGITLKVTSNVFDLYAPAFIGGGVAIVVLVGVAIAIVTRRKKNDVTGSTSVN